MPIVSPRRRWQNLMRAWVPFKMRNTTRNRQSSIASDETVDIPREFPPPTIHPQHSFFPSSYPVRSRRVLSSSSSESAFSDTEKTILIRNGEPNGKVRASTTFEHPTQRPEAESWDREYVHWCRECHRPRSKSYHRANPLRPGEKPTSGICSRCLPIEQLDGRRSPSPPVVWSSDSKGTEEIIIRDNRTFIQNAPRTIRIIRHRYVSPERKIRPNSSGPKVSESLEPRGRLENPQMPEPCFKDDKSYGQCRVRVSVSPVNRSRAIEETSRHTRAQAASTWQDDRYNHVDVETPKGPPSVIPHPIVVCHDHRQHQRDGDSSLIDKRIASHPSAWSYVRRVPVREERTHFHEADAGRSPSPPREPSPPEWFYRSRVRVRSPSVSQRLRSSPSPPRYTSQRPPEESKRRYPVPLPSTTLPPREVSQAPKNSTPYDCYSKAKNRRKQGYRYPTYTSSDDDDEPRHSGGGRVRFAPISDQEKAKQRDIQAKRDDREAQRDRTTFEDTKEKIRRTVSKGGGRYEVDGANDMEYLHYNSYEQAGPTISSVAPAASWSRSHHAASPTESVEVNVDDSSFKNNDYTRSPPRTECRR